MWGMLIRENSLCRLMWVLVFFLVLWWVVFLVVLVFFMKLVGRV